MVTDSTASGPDTHLDPDRMADLSEGLLEPDTAEAARRHLAGCAQCADDFALITLDSGLAAFLAPEPIPAEVAIRVEAALHREPPLTPPSAAAAGSGASPAAAPRRSRRFRLAFGSLAGATLVVAGAFAGITALNSGSEDAKSSMSSAKGGSYSSQPSTVSGDSQVGVAPNAAPSGAPRTAMAPSNQLAGGSAANGADVERQAGQLLRTYDQNHPQTAAGNTTEAKPDAGAPFACPPSGLQDAKPLGMASITYQGSPAELLVYAKPGDDAHASVYVVATTGCTTAAPGEILFASEVPRR